MVKCPECGALLDIESDEVKEGEILTCPECDVELEVVNTHPLELDVIEEEEEAGDENILESDDEEPEEPDDGRD